MRLATGVLWAAVTILGFRSMAGCGGDSGNGAAAGGKCTNLSGTWNVSGGCPPSSCTFDQSGCQITMLCDDGTKASGAVNGSSLTFSGSGMQCSADVNVGTGGSPGASGSCRISQRTCNFDATCASGACAHPNGLGGAGGAVPNPAPCPLLMATGTRQDCSPTCSQITSEGCCKTVTVYNMSEGTMCATGCADLQTDARNCASCGKACSIGEACVAGSCVVSKMDAGSGGSTGAGGGTSSGASSGAGGTTQVAPDAGTHRASAAGSGGVHP
ncbi:MAG TPA: hypothetical protein VHC69_10180 [Polyangiaceae bacterium]|nr:hypothetical protein [Polyangiaceae bacterium]